MEIGKCAQYFCRQGRRNWSEKGGKTEKYTRKKWGKGKGEKESTVGERSGGGKGHSLERGEGRFLFWSFFSGVWSVGRSVGGYGAEKGGHAIG